VPTHAARPTARAYDSYDAVALIAEWQQGPTKMTLSQATRGAAFSLVIVDVPVEALARTAQESAVVMDAREAPARDAALQKKREEDARAAEERTRATNKRAFVP
jgi:hypothetical protein